MFIQGKACEIMDSALRGRGKFRQFIARASFARDRGPVSMVAAGLHCEF